MNKWMILAVAAVLWGCSGDKSADNSDTGGADVSTTDMSSNNANNTLDVNNGLTPDLNDPMDMGTTDTGGDMAAEDLGMDMTEFPDVMVDNCAHPTTDPSCPMGEFGAGTFLNTIELVQDGTCCRDFTGDGNPDNKIGQYAGFLMGAGEDINANIQAAVQQGLLAYLLEYANWGNETFDADLDFRVFLGTDTDLDYADNLAGTGAFNLLPESFDMNGAPKWPFDNTTVNNGRLVATDGTLELFFPNLLDEVQMLMTDVRIEADVIPPADLASGGGVTLENGEISGALHRDLFYDSMNEASNACVCLQKNVFVYEPNADQYECDIDMADEMNCMMDPSSGCRFLANRQACQFFELASSDVDIDTDGDNVNDAFSVGVRFTGIPASIAGRQ